MFQLTVEGHFSAAHSLREYKGKCERLHGHNWKVEAVFESEKLGSEGMVLDFKDARKLLKETIGEFDHECINELDSFSEINPTTENIAKHIFIQLKNRLPEGVRVKKITTWETPGSGAAYFEE